MRYLTLALVLGVSLAVPVAQGPVRADGEFLRRAYDTYTSMRQASPYRALTWSYLGPTNISGRATDIAVADRAGQRRIYAAYATSGVWKTDDDGKTWQAIFEHMPSTSIGDIAVAPVQSRHRLGRHRRSEHLPRLDGGRRHLQVHRRGQDVDPHGPHRHPDHRPHHRPPDRSEHSVRRGVRSRMDRQRNARRVQDDQRRQVVGQDLLQERPHRRERPGDGSARSERPLRQSLAAHPPQMERPARRAGLQRGRRDQDDRRRQDLGGRESGPAAARASWPHRHRPRALEARHACTPWWTTTRSARMARPERERRLRPADAAGQGIHQGRRRLSQRRRRQDVAADEPLRRSHHESAEQPFRHLRLGVRTDPRRPDRPRTPSGSWASRSASRPTAARRSRPSAACTPIITACGSTRRTPTSSTTPTTAASIRRPTAARPGASP